MFCLFQNQDQFVDTIDLILDTLNQRSECISDIINEGIRDPVRGDADVIFELFNATADVLRVGCWSEVEL